MTNTDTTEITAAEWLDVRDHVADVVRKAAPNTQKPTAVNVAEQLLRRGYIDVDKVRAELAAERAEKATAEGQPD